MHGAALVNLWVRRCRMRADALRGQQTVCIGVPRNAFAMPLATRKLCVGKEWISTELS